MYSGLTAELVEGLGRDGSEGEREGMQCSQPPTSCHVSYISRGQFGTMYHTQLL